MEPISKEKLTRLLQFALVAGATIICLAGIASIGRGQYRIGSVYALMGGVIALMANRIARRKREQEELKRLNELLEQRVQARTTELDASNKELEAFSYSVAHDLRAPLRHMGGFIALLEKHSGSSLDEKSQRYLQIISDSAKKMGLLIDHLLEFSRTGRMELERKVVDLSKLAEESLQELREATGERNIHWNVGKLPVAYVDRSMMRLVLNNLLANAVKFTSKRTDAEIEVGYQDDHENEIVVFVRDNGVGFDMKYVDKLFGVFQRLHRPEDYEGTGIGLANVQRIVRRHGGRVWAEGRVNEGATFYFSLPRMAEEANRAKAQAHAAG